jgi:hypothetical protein
MALEVREAYDELADHYHLIFLHTSRAYQALLRDDLTGVLGEAGFRNIRWLFPVDTGFYQPLVLAKAQQSL